MSVEGQLKVMPDMRDVSTDDDFQTPGTMDEREPVSSGPTAGPTQTRSTKPPKMRKNRLGPSEPSIARPESTQIAAEGKVQAPAQRSESIPELSAPHTFDNNTEAPPMTQDSNSSPEVLPPVATSTAYDLDHMEDEPIAMPAQPNPTPVAPRQDPFEQVDDQFDDLDGNMDGLQAIARNELPPPDIQLQGPSNQSSNVHSPVVKFGETTVNSFNRPLSESRSLSVSSVPLSNHETLLNDSNNLTIGITDGAKTIDPPELITIPEVEAPKPSLPVEPSIDLDSKASRRRTLLRRLRKVLLRRRVLALLLGRELGEVTYADLNQATEIGSLRSAPLRF